MFPRKFYALRLLLRSLLALHAVLSVHLHMYGSNSLDVHMPMEIPNFWVSSTEYYLGLLMNLVSFVLGSPMANYSWMDTFIHDYQHQDVESISHLSQLQETSIPSKQEGSKPNYSLMDATDTINMYTHLLVTDKFGLRYT